MSVETKVLIYTIESAVGVLIALLFIIDKISIMRVAHKRHLTFSYFVSRAQAAAGICFIAIEVFATFLGWLAFSENDLITKIFVDILLLNNTLFILGIFIMWIGGYLVLNHEDNSRTSEF